MTGGWPNWTVRLTRQTMRIADLVEDASRQQASDGLSILFGYKCRLEIESAELLGNAGLREKAGNAAKNKDDQYTSIQLGKRRIAVLEDEVGQDRRNWFDEPFE